MKSQVLIIQKPSIDFNAFLTVASQVLGYNPAAASDKSSKKMTDSERLILCLQALKNPDALKFRDYFLKHINLSVMVLALEADLLEVMEICATMPLVSTTTLRRDVGLVILTGTVKQWREAVAIGCSKDVSLTIGVLFTDIYQVLVKDGYGFVWNSYSVKNHNHGQLLLEYVG